MTKRTKGIGASVVRRVIRYGKLLGPTSAVLSVLGKLSGQTFTKTFKRAGIRHPVTLRLPSSDMDAYEQIFVEKQYEFSPAKSPAVIVDAGANVGLAAIFFAHRFPSAKIYAIECESSNFALLQANVAPYPNVIAIHAALWDHDGSISVVDPGLGKWGFMTQAAPDPNVWSSSVSAITVGSMMRQHGISKIDIFKMDIEGAELEVLKASEDWMPKVDVFIAELHDWLKPGCEAIFAKSTASFPNKWLRGENHYASRSAALDHPP